MQTLVLSGFHDVLLDDIVPCDMALHGTYRGVLLADPRCLSDTPCISMAASIPPTAVSADIPKAQEAGAEGLAQPLDFDTVYTNYSAFVAGRVYRLLGRDDEVDDIVQEVFAALHRALPKLRHPAAVGAWLKTVITRTVFRRIRRRKLLRYISLSSDDESSVPEEIAPTLAPEDRDMLKRIYAVLDQMPAGERLAWSLRYLEGESVDDVATLCNCSRSTAKRRIAAAQLRLSEVTGHG